ncbi:hypothetical protein LCGC14_1839020, partial [marine sediment metagenome]
CHVAPIVIEETGAFTTTHCACIGCLVGVGTTNKMAISVLGADTSEILIANNVVEAGRIAVADATRVSIIGNHVTGTVDGQNCIGVAGGSLHHIANNFCVIKVNASNGIHVESPNCRVCNNFVYTTTTGNRGYTAQVGSDGSVFENNTGIDGSRGFYMYAGATDITVRNNFFSGQTLTNLEKAGSGDIAYMQGNIGGFFTASTDGITLPVCSDVRIDSDTNKVDCNLPDGNIVGQTVAIRMINSDNASDISVDTHATSSPEIALFDAIGEQWVLIWDGVQWVDVGTPTCTFP